ncbi:hypothetical protein LMG18101_04240 [Ralstonia flaminis]|jgi:hypothetical protein|uniref:Tc1-like transposase DDE domain-containing protein n=1 Tax=Ralstonia flaminis TaxID=3058597 RepID=A0ABM9K911_9RALS|nr:hypothetical protein LMG18101_04240 [Ralstonia sp. LMG 18101]
MHIESDTAVDRAADSLIAIAFLTQYAPELNPVAAIWARVKRV